MLKKETVLNLLLPTLILIPMILLVLLVPKNAWKDGNYPLTGRYIETTTGQHVIYRNTDTGGMRFVFLIPRDKETSLDDFETGDAIRVQSEPRIQETDDGIYYSRVYESKKIRNTPQIPELTEDILSYVESLDAKFPEYNSAEEIQPEVAPNSVVEQAPPAGLTKGTVEIFKHDGLVLEISNVKEISKGSSFDGMETWEYDIYVVYPGATLKILDPDTFVDEESNLDHANWAIFTSDDNRIDIDKGMQPLELNTNIVGVYDPESSVYVLGFQIYDS